ncbi:MAG: acetyltransferase [Saprospiraceae bacterium]|nr:MAG: acetyltransferase [Saprospiraceae bacterium]
MEIRKYLDRINDQGELVPTLAVLGRLQLNHMLNVPFENLDIHFGRPIELEVQKLYEKIVVHTRGGFCYELNGLFYELLKSIGFEVKMVSACVHNSTKNAFGPEFDHMALIIHIDGTDYLADVGFGKFATGPLKLQLNTNQEDGRAQFKMEPYAENHILVSKKEKQDWNPEYIFSQQARQLDEYTEMCIFQQTSPDSHFTQNRVCSLLTHDGRITISGNKLLTTSETAVTETILKDEQAFEAVLLEYFGIRV